MSSLKRVLGGVLAAMSAVALAACSSSGTGNASKKDADGPVKLTFVGYGGDGQNAMIADWQKAYTAQHKNVSFVNTSPPDVAQVKAQVLSGKVQWDVINTSPAAAEQNCGTLFAPLTFSGLDKSRLVDQAVGKCYIGNFVNSTPMAYRTDAFPDPAKAPKTIADFFDTKKFPGKRGVVTNLQNGILEYPLLADGVAPNDLYPLDVDRALKKWSTIRSDTLFAPNVGALQQAVAAKQVDVFLLSDSRLVPLLNDGNKITIVWDKTVTSLNAFAVPKGSKNLKAAEEFVQFVSGPAPQAGLAAALGVSAVNKDAKPQLSANAAKLQALDPNVNPGTVISQDVNWYAKNFNEATVKLTNWLNG
jgi:putative spermidine/putrescine transport system substrate-binding protein